MAPLTACTALDSPEVSELRSSHYIGITVITFYINAFPPFPHSVLRLIRYLAFIELNSCI